MKVENLNIIELKALAYDYIAQKEACQKKLVEINGLIVAKAMEADNEQRKITDNIKSASGKAKDRKQEPADTHQEAGKKK